MSPNWASTVSLWIPNKIVAQGETGGAPISVTTFCNQYVPPNWKTLFVMRSLNASIKTAGRKSRCFSFSRANRPMRWSDGTVLIFLYMEVASQINRRVFDGIFVCQVSFRHEWILKIWFMHSSKGLQPFCDEPTQRMQDITTVLNDQACLQRNLMHLKREIKESPWLLFRP